VPSTSTRQAWSAAAGVHAASDGEEIVLVDEVLIRSTFGFAPNRQPKGGLT
jgi:hypothetical protein